MTAALAAALWLACAASAGPDVPAAPAVPEPVLLAALPWRNLTPEPGAAEPFVERIHDALRERGARFVPRDDIERILRARRIRYTDSVSVEAARAIAEATGADFLLLGTLIDLDVSSPPRISATLRVLDTATGQRVHSSVVSLRGKDFEGLLGLGIIEDPEALADEVVARIVEGFDERGAPRVTAADPASLDDVRPSDALVRYRREGFELASIDRLAVLPFANRTRRLDAGLLFSEILADQWLDAVGIRVVERSELLAAMVRERVRSIDQVDIDVLSRVGGAVGTRYFVIGAVDEFADDVTVGEDAFPEIEASMRILDVQTGRIVAAAGLLRRGDHYHVLLGLGNVRDTVALAARAAREIVALVAG